MSMSPATRPTGRVRRTAAAVGLGIILVLPLGVIFAQLWVARAADLSFNQAERRGVRYLGPLTDLLDTVTQQQSGVVHGRGVIAGDVDQTVAAVDAVDREVGAPLQTTQRWVQLREQILQLTDRADLAPADAFTAYSGVVDLVVQLIRKVGDASNLILDPRTDTYYLMNATLLRIPEVLVESGRYTDLVRIVAGTPRATDPDTLAQLASVRAQVLAGADDLTEGLRKSFEATASNSLVPTLLRQLDEFRANVDKVAPRVSPVQAAPARSPDPTAVQPAQDDLQRVALALDGTALGQLDVLLKTRVDAISRQRRYAEAALLVGVLASVFVVVWLGPGRRALRPPRRHGDRAATVDARELVATSGMPLPARRGGARAAR
jgi:hypothetical protein